MPAWTDEAMIPPAKASAAFARKALRGGVAKDREDHSRTRIVLFAALALGLAVRLPFWVEALKAPLAADTAIVGLMARHPAAGLGFWGQPYGSPLEAWLAAPLVGLLGPTRQALRLLYFALGLGLIPAAIGLGRTVDARLMPAVALIAACPPPYFLELSALPPPLYPVTLILCASLLIVALRAGDALSRGERPRAGLLLWGGLAGLALWTHLMSASVVLASFAYLAGKGRRRWRLLTLAVAGLLVTSAPLWRDVLSDRGPFQVVEVSSSDESGLHHAATLLPQLYRPLGGLLGIALPATPDDPEPIVHAPRWAGALLAVFYGISLVHAMWRLRRNGTAALLGACMVLGVVGFLVSLRSAPTTVRYLTPVYLPLAVLALWPHALDGGRRRALILALGVASLHLVGSARLLSAWHELASAAPPFGVPDLAPVRNLLEAHGIRRAYASYEPAYTLTYESGEAIVVSQPWNQRFPEHPLPYVDEVRFARNVAWLLTPSIPSDLPSPREFEAALAESGGRCRRAQAGAAIAYFDFVPPFGAHVEPLTAAGSAGDADVATRLTMSAPLTVVLPSPRPLDAVTLVEAAGGPALPRGIDLEVSSGGASFELVAGSGRSGRHHLHWVNGQPQYVLAPELLALPVAGRQVSALRITPRSHSRTWAVGEILLHPTEPREQLAPWEDWLDPTLSWAERRRVLAAEPRRDREDWYYRTLLAARN